MLVGPNGVGNAIDLQNLDLFVNSVTATSSMNLNLTPISSQQSGQNDLQLWTISTKNVTNAQTVLTNAFSIRMNCVAGSTGGFNAFFSQLNISGKTGNNTSAPSGDYGAATFIAQAEVNDNGTSGTAHGSLFGFNPLVNLGSNATFWVSIVGGEIDVAAQAGSSLLHKIGLQIVQTSIDGTVASISNVAYLIGNQNGAQGWDVGYCFGGATGHNPMRTTGTLIGTWAGNATQPNTGAGAYGTVATGIDFSAYTITGNFLNSTGFSVSGSGAIVCTLPSSDPHVVGALWNSSGTVHVSAG